MRGMSDPKFMEMINGTFLSFTSAVLCHTLRAWKTGIYLEPKDFKFDTSIGMDYVL